jgi:carbon storage regulator
MLVVSRKKNEVIMLGDNIRLVVVQIKGEKVRLGIEAPLEMPVHRQEVYDAIQRDNDDRNTDSA